MSLAPTDIGKRIAEARNARGWTQLRFAAVGHHASDTQQMEGSMSEQMYAEKQTHDYNAPAPRYPAMSEALDAIRTGLDRLEHQTDALHERVQTILGPPPPSQNGSDLAKIAASGRPDAEPLVNELFILSARITGCSDRLSETLGRLDL